MKRYKEKPFLEQLKNIPNISLACEKVGLSRNTIYRWCQEDPDFKRLMEEALESGVNSVNDLAHSKLTKLINDGSLPAIKFWLENNDKTYIRPRPKSFWEDLRGHKDINEIQITFMDSKESSLNDAPPPENK
jgi:hypothetical protein